MQIRPESLPTASRAQWLRVGGRKFHVGLLPAQKHTVHNMSITELTSLSLISPLCLKCFRNPCDSVLLSAFNLVQLEAKP